MPSTGPFFNFSETGSSNTANVSTRALAGNDIGIPPRPFDWRHFLSGASQPGSSDVQCALAVAGRIQSGIRHINGPTLHDQAQMPFGGVKGSGYGRFGGKAAITEFTDLRWITIEDSAHYPF
ncbi:hypothetical protein FHX05_005573 [Rhizobium sp. BK491]|nr:hypothetical protein [Rhizobium sp. BK491]